MKLRMIVAAMVPAIGMTVGAAYAADQKAVQQRTAAPPSTQDQNLAQAQQDVRMSQLIGMDVRNARGENLGEINDLVLDVVSGEVQYAVVGFGGFLGLGEKLFAFPMSAFRVALEPQRGGLARPLDNDGVRGDRGPIGTDRAATVPGRGPLDNDGVRGDRGPIGTDRPAAAGQARADAMRSDAFGRPAPMRGSRDFHLVLNVDQARLKDAPGFDKSRWPDWNDPQVRTDIDRFAGVNRTGGTVASNPSLFRGSKLLDVDVHDAQNRDIGDIEDVVVDLRTGQVRYAVIEFDRGWFNQDKLVAVPMKALRPLANNREGDLMLDADRSRLERAPAFGKNQWPDLNRGPYRNNLEGWLASWDERGVDRTMPASGARTEPRATQPAAPGTVSR